MFFNILMISTSYSVFPRFPKPQVGGSSPFRDAISACKYGSRPAGCHHVTCTANSYWSKRRPARSTPAEEAVMPAYMLDCLDLVGQLDEGRPQLGRASRVVGVLSHLLPCSRTRPAAGYD